MGRLKPIEEDRLDLSSIAARESTPDVQIGVLVQ